jgi:hypothetical protein
MRLFDIFITYLSWGGGGKSRPVLVVFCDENIVKIYQITTRFENKSPAVRSKYFEITDWKQAGLDKKSYVDTNNTFELNKSGIQGQPIGRLTESDKLKLLEFLSR